jgi:hypothetical protein
VISSDEDVYIPEGDEEEPLTKDQEAFVASKVTYCAQHVKVLKAEEVRKICVEFEFEEEKIDEYLRFYDIEEKYKDVAAF